MTLPLARIGPWLVRYFHFERRLRLRPSYRDDAPEYRGTTSSSSPSAPELDRLIDNLAFREVLGLLRSRTGCDFEPYKHVTMLRRIARRMQVQGSEDLRDYLQILGQQPDEAGALLQDLLVSASNFFREPAAFKALGARLPALFAGKGPRDVVRVWMAGCATGEEAYSVAMMLREHALMLDTSPLLRLVAHDLNSYALGQARAGFYAGMLDVDVIDDRLARFFTREAGGYRVRREIREMVVFLAHDLLEDPDLPSQDLVVCRNVLVYLGARARARVLQHIARVLRPAGLLMLGPQEALPEHHPHFVVVDRAHRLYARRSGDGTAGPDAGAT
jgi:two-component system CheB/CheR fusion protein